MKRGAILTLIIVFSVIASLTAGFVILKQYMPEHNWQPTLSHKSSHPYGTRYLYDLLKASYAEDNFIELKKRPQTIIPESDTNSLLFYIGYNTFFDSLSIEWIRKYMINGNKVCFASNQLPYQLIKKLASLDSADIHAHYMFDSIVHTRFNSDTNNLFAFHYQHIKKKQKYYWAYFSDEDIDKLGRSRHINKLSEIDSNRINYIEVKVGKGGLYLYTTPILLSNYYLSTEEGYNYATMFFNTIGKTDKLYWENYLRLPHRTGGNGLNLDSDNPLEFILSNKELRWAWYVFLLGVLLFILFKLKRRQAPIPVIVPDKNTSVEYAKAVGLLYYKKAPHTDLAEQLMKLFQTFVKNRYNTNIQDKKEKQIQHIALHSGLKEKEIAAIFDAGFKIKYNPEAEKSQTIELQSILEYFYQNCK